ncbi:MAG: bifunctional oligoribonuclease/PAP phosphatase NrnA [candidate division Zixibacteria bacterium]|nr:bifunctional oligoribonuclease/PAP phosphatase NrnA [candidate division Zixibacteria bacterium]
MTDKAVFKKINDLFKKEDYFLLTSHLDPDGDSIGSLIGLREFLKSLGKKVVAYNDGNLPDKYKFLVANNQIRFSNQAPEFKPRVAVILECPEIARIGFVQNFINTDMIRVNIDHHPRNKLYGDLNYVDESASAVAEILYDIIKSNGHNISPKIAESFYAAIASDTGRFKFANTSSKCFSTASQLVEAGANPKLISDKIFSTYSAGTIKLLGNLLENLELHDNGNICILKLTLENLNKYGVNVADTEGIIDYSLVISGVKVGILFKEQGPQSVKVGLRSQNSIDISRFARSKGGGGHANAAGFKVNNDLNKTVANTVAEVAAYLNG